MSQGVSFMEEGYFTLFQNIGLSEHREKLQFGNMLIQFVQYG